MSIQYRQGDVLLVEVGDLPKSARVLPNEGADVVLAYGEKTGHRHAISAESAQLLKDNSTVYLRARHGAVLSHQEHSAIPIEPGLYKVVLQTQYAEPPKPARSVEPYGLAVTDDSEKWAEWDPCLD